MASEVQIILKAVDQASGEIGKVTKSMSTLGDFAKGALKVGMIAAGAAATALGAGLAISIKEAMDAQVVMGQLDAVLKSTGGAAGVTKEMAIGLADGLSGVTRFSDDAILSGENMLLTFTNIGKDVFPDATKAILDLSTATGQDLKSSALQLGKALNDPIQGISALQRVGVTFTDAQKEMIQKLVESGDVMGAQKIILAELSREFGGSAEAAGKTFAGQLDILKNSLLNVAEGIGTAILPVLGKLLNDFILPLMPAIQAFGEKLAEAIGKIASGDLQGALEGLFGADIAGKIMGVVEGIQGLAKTIGDFVTGTLMPFIQTHSEEFKGALTALAIAFGVVAVVIPVVTALIAALTSPITLIIGAVALLGAAWAGNWGGIQDKTEAVINFLRPFIEGFLNAIKAFWEANGAAIMAAAQTAWETIKAVITAAANVIKAVVSAFTAAVKAFWDAHGAAIIATAQRAWNLIQTTITSIANAIKTAVSSFLSAVKAFWDAHGAAIIEAAKKTWDTIKTTIDTITKIIIGVVNAFISLFEGDWQGFIDGIKSAWETGWNAIVSVVSGLWDNIKGAITSAISNIKSAFSNVDWGSVGKAIISGIAGAIRNGVGSIIQAAKDAAKAALDAAKGALGIKSPSEAFMEVGKSMMDGMALGIAGSARFPAIAAVSAAGMAARQVTNHNTYYLNAQYGYQNQTSLSREIKMLEMLRS